MLDELSNFHEGSMSKQHMDMDVDTRYSNLVSYLQKIEKKWAYQTPDKYTNI